LKTQKITLPLIHSIERSSLKDKRKIKSILKKKKYLLSDKKLVNEFITKYNGFEYAHQTMNDFKKNALELLKDFPQNESNNSIKILLDYIIERKY
jgi:octaprenyl-diphosphate synthase